MAKHKTHTISIMVANKPGVLVRVALVFSRRAYNIDSLVVSSANNLKYSRMTITAKGDPDTLEQIIKQCNKLVDVIHAEEHDPSKSVDREYALAKIKAADAKKATIVNAIKEFKAKIINSDDEMVIIEQVGTSEELNAFEALLKKQGVAEVVRTGKVLMATGKDKT